MTIIAPINPDEQDNSVYVFENPPCIPFYKKNRMEKAKYLQWLIDNVNADTQVNAREQMHPQTGEIETMHPLNHLVRIAGQYHDLNAAKCALNNLKSPSVNGAPMPSESLSLSDSDQVQLLETLLDLNTVSWNKQRWITIGDFFKHIFPRLRPSQQGYLPCIYRTHLSANGELVANGSSIAIELTQRNYENMANASGSLQTHLEQDMVEAETMIRPHLRQEMQGHATVPPSQVADIPRNQIDHGSHFGNLENPWIRPENWQQQQELIRLQLDKDAEVAFQRELARAEDAARLIRESKKIDSELRIQERRDAAALKGEADERKHRNDIAMFDHKQQFRTNSSTRSQSRRGRNLLGSNHDFVPLPKILVHPEWDTKNPIDERQFMALVLDKYIESGTTKTTMLPMDCFTRIASLSLQHNTLGLDSTSLDDNTFAWTNDLRKQKEFGNMALELIRCAKDQFPKADKGSPKRLESFPLELRSYDAYPDTIMYVKFKHPEIEDLNRFWVNRPRNDW